MKINSLINKIKRMRIKNEIDKGHYIIINFKKIAEYFCVGTMINKQIEHYYNNELIKVEDYHPIKIDLYSEDDIPIIDLTLNKTVPNSCVEEPEAILDNTEPIIFELNEQ